MYLVYNFGANLLVSKDHFVHDLLYLQLCTNHANVSNCLVLRTSHLHGVEWKDE